MVSIAKVFGGDTIQQRILFWSGVTNAVKVLLALLMVIVLDTHHFHIDMVVVTVLVGWLLASIVVNGCQSIWCILSAHFPNAGWLRYTSMVPCLALMGFVVFNSIWINGSFEAFTWGCFLYVTMIIYTHAREITLIILTKAIKRTKQDEDITTLRSKV